VMCDFQAALNYIMNCDRLSQDKNQTSVSLVQRWYAHRLHSAVSQHCERFGQLQALSGSSPVTKKRYTLHLTNSFH